MSASAGLAGSTLYHLTYLVGYVGLGLGLAGAVAGYAMIFWEVSVPVAILLALAASVLVGLFNGLLVAKVRVNPLIATLGMMSVVRGIVPHAFESGIENSTPTNQS